MKLTRRLISRILVVFLMIASTLASSFPAQANSQSLALEQSLLSPALAPGSLPGSYSPPFDPEAASGPSANDRDNSTPTAWYIWAHQSAAQVTAFINTGYRLVDLSVESVSPSYLFTAVFVANSGSYQKSWWWYYGVDAATLSTYLAANHARLTSLKAYDIGSGQIRFAAVMVSNTGDDQTAWWWYYGVTVSDVSAYLNTHQARLTQVHSYQTGGQTRYAVVMVDNTGVNARAWWWYVNTQVSDVSGYLNTNQARLVDLDVDAASGKLNVIMNSCSSGCPAWWWYVGIPENQILAQAAQNGARMIDVNSYPGCGSTCYDFILINNSNALTTRVGQMLRGGTDGDKGLFLKQVGGPVLANLMDGFQFEPASTIKATVHLYTLMQVQSGAVSLTTLIPKYDPPVSGSCPGNTASGSESIQAADQEMMWHSDNTRTRELVDYFGAANINTWLSSIGLAHTSINHIIGCGGPVPNQTTLDDLGALYEGVANGTLLDAAHRLTFFSQMAGTAQYQVEGYDWTHLYDTDIPKIIDQEAPQGMPVSLKNDFRSKIQLAYKAGNYKLCTSSGCATYVDDISISGYAQIPFCTATGSRKYVFGIFIYNSTSDASSSATFDATKAELLREPIQAGLASCFRQVYLPVAIR